MESSWALRAALLVALVMVIHFQVDAVSGSPVLDDYAENRIDPPSLYELLLQREMMADKAMEGEGRGHMVVRKSDRSPSLRLRFGRSVGRPSSN